MWRYLIDKMLTTLIREGRLEVRFPDGTRETYGGGEPAVSVTLTDPALLKKLVLNPDLAVGEAYMEGTLVIGDDDVAGFLALAIRNFARRDPWVFQRAFDAFRRSLRWVKTFNPAWRARKNVAHHYDLSEDLYRSFLDSDMQYSCAYFRDPGMTLEAAQEAKKRHIASKLLIKPGMKVLDIGCGWGGMAITLAKDYGAQVTGITLSREQLEVAQQRVRDAGLADRIELRLQDYRDVKGAFDRVVSVGMFEHVGPPDYRTYFRIIRGCLAPDGVALVHTIGRSGPPAFTSPWIAKYIFPGGYVPAMSEAVGAVESERLILTDVEVWRLHYAETLKAWRTRFEAASDRLAVQYDERFRRMWRWYLCLCEMAFRYNDQVVFQFQIARDKGAVPVTRDYLASVSAPDVLAESTVVEMQNRTRRAGR